MKTSRYAALAGLLAFVAAPAFGQRADHKITGDAFRHGQARTYQQHAQDRAQTLYYYYYNQPKPQISKQEAKEMVGAIRKDLTVSDKALADLKAAHAKEPEVVKQIELIQKHHAKAHEVCGMAEEECTKEHGDHVVCAECCSQMWHELDAAKAETEKLFKMLKIEKLPPPKKVEPKKDAPKKETPNK